MTLSSLTGVMLGAALCSLACAYEVNDWKNGEPPVRARSSVSPGGAAGSTAGGDSPSSPALSGGGPGGGSGGAKAAAAGGGGSAAGGGTDATDDDAAGAAGVPGGEQQVLGGAAGQGGAPAAGGAEEAGGAAGAPPAAGGGAGPVDACAALPDWEARSYDAYEQVTDGAFIYECKPWPETDWCGASELHYKPGTGSDWDDAWIQVGPC